MTAEGVADGGSPIPLDGVSLDSNPSASTLTYNTANNRITSSGFEYDVNGNMIRAKAEDGSCVSTTYNSTRQE